MVLQALSVFTKKNKHFSEFNKRYHIGRMKCGFLGYANERSTLNPNIAYNAYCRHFPFYLFGNLTFIVYIEDGKSGWDQICATVTRPDYKKPVFFCWYKSKGNPGLVFFSTDKNNCLIIVLKQFPFPFPLLVIFVYRRCWKIRGKRAKWRISLLYIVKFYKVYLPTLLTLPSFLGLSKHIITEKLWKKKTKNSD